MENDYLVKKKPILALFIFALPMIIGNFFQQMYTMADSAVVGRYVGEEALAAVGVSYSLTTVFICIAIGGGIGASVTVSRYFGAKMYKRMKTAVFTAFIAFLAVSIFLGVFGLVFSKKIIILLNTPSNVIDMAVEYLNIYFLGLPFLFMYNVVSSMFNALGKSKIPLYFLIFSSVLNIILDILLVTRFNMGVVGVAWATFIAQGISSLLAFAVLLKRVHGIKSGTYKKFSFRMLGHISRIAIPSILQQSFVSVGNLFIQSRVNSFGSDVIAGYSAAIKLNTFAITSFSTLGNAMSSYTAQNTGARKLLRIPEGLKAGIVMLIVVSLPFFIAYFVFPNTMMNIFVKSSEAGIIDVGRIFLKIVTPFYFVISAKLTFDGILRGAGRMRAFMASTFTDLLLRVILAYVFSYALNSEVGIWLSWPVGWTIAAVISAVFYFIYYKTTIKNGAN